MTIRIDKKDRTQFMRKYYVNGTSLEVDPLLLVDKPLSSYLKNFTTHRVTDYDRLDLISFKYYDTSDYWWLILLANDMISVDEVVPNKELLIPSLRDYQDWLDTFNF